MPRLLAAGVPVVLGSDYAPSTVSTPFEMIRAALMQQRDVAGADDALTIEQALVMATTSGTSLGRPGRLGRVAVGQLADLVLVDTTGLHHLGVDHPYQPSVYVHAPLTSPPSSPTDAYLSNRATSSAWTSPRSPPRPVTPSRPRWPTAERRIRRTWLHGHRGDLAQSKVVSTKCDLVDGGAKELSRLAVASLIPPPGADLRRDGVSVARDLAVEHDAEGV